MCGIVGYKGKGKASEILLNSIKTLEYRGYDSVGMATLSSGQITVKKDVGKIAEVDAKVNFTAMEGSLGVAHTRWATHGGVTQANAHPQVSQNGKIAVVHNGIIENFQGLKKELVSNGFEFKSGTDTEVLPQFIQYHMDNGKSFEEAVRETLKQIEGSFAVVAVHQDDNKLIGARRGSPLVVGVGDGEYFLASDVPAFLEYTKKVIYLDDDEFVVVNDGLAISRLDDASVIEKDIQTIEWTMEQAKKGDYPHYMLKEIIEQKETIKLAIEQDPLLIEQVTKMLQNAFGIFFVGCGTSYHACVSASYEFAHVAKKHVNVTLASEFKNHENFLTDKTVMVAVSQSGETADLLDAVKVAKKHGVKIISVVNVMGSTLTRLADLNIMMNSGPEICVLSTKSYTSQLAILMLLAYAVANKTDEGKKQILDACDRVSDIIDENLEKLKELASQIKDRPDMFLIGRDLAYPSALEGALKIKEVSYIHAEGFAGGELKHGTIALIEEGVPTIVLTTNKTRNLILSNAMEIKARGGYMIGVDEKENELYDYHIKVPDVNSANPILMIIPIQILAYYLALERGCDPDMPRNLAKSVTVR